MSPAARIDVRRQRELRDQRVADRRRPRRRPPPLSAVRHMSRCSAPSSAGTAHPVAARAGWRVVGGDGDGHVERLRQRTRRWPSARSLVAVGHLHQQRGRQQHGLALPQPGERVPVRRPASGRSSAATAYRSEAAPRRPPRRRSRGGCARSAPTSSTRGGPAGADPGGGELAARGLVRRRQVGRRFQGYGDGRATGGPGTARRPGSAGSARRRAAARWSARSDRRPRRAASGAAARPGSARSSAARSRAASASEKVGIRPVAGRRWRRRSGRRSPGSISMAAASTSTSRSNGVRPRQAHRVSSARTGAERGRLRGRAASAPGRGAPLSVGARPACAASRASTRATAADSARRCRSVRSRSARVACSPRTFTSPARPLGRRGRRPAGSARRRPAPAPGTGRPRCSARADP